MHTHIPKSSTRSVWSADQWLVELNMTTSPLNSLDLAVYQVLFLYMKFTPQMCFHKNSEDFCPCWVPESDVVGALIWWCMFVVCWDDTLFRQGPLTGQMSFCHSVSLHFSWQALLWLRRSAHSLQLLLDTQRFPSQVWDIISPAGPQGVGPVGHAWYSSRGSCRRGILVRCPNHLNWLILIQKNRSSTLRQSLIVRPKNVIVLIILI